MWAALTAGCFLGPVCDADYVSEVGNWWSDNTKPITVQHVIEEWQIAEEGRRKRFLDATGDSTLHNVHASLGAVETVLENGKTVLAIIHGHLASRHARMTEVRQQLLDVLNPNVHCL